MPYREISKNSRDVIRITPTRFHDNDLIDVRVYFSNSKDGTLGPTKKGIAVAVDLVPALIDALIWAVGQPCDENANSTERKLPEAEADKLAHIAWDVLKKHGAPVHWDSAERMVLEHSKHLTKWDLHYVLTTRRDLFTRLDNGCFAARDT